MESQSQSTKTLSSPVIPWKTRLQLTIASTVTAASRRENGTINRRLLNILSYNSPPSPTTPINGVTSSDITVDDSRKLWFRLFIPTVTSTETSSLPVMVFFHGGGFVYLAANNKAYDAVCRRFARKMQVIVISVDYRLAPEYKYPAQYDDGFDVLKFIDDEENFRQILPENADLSSCFLAGDSAGGNLAHHVAKRACEAKFRTLKVIGVLAIQPFFGGEERTESEIRLDGVDPLVSIKRTDWMWNAFITQQDGINRDHEVINVSGPKAVDMSKLNFPAVFVVVGGFDPLQDWQKRYYEWLKQSGKEAYILEYPNMVHAFYIFPELPESAHIISQMKEFIFNQVSNNAKT